MNILTDLLLCAVIICSPVPADYAQKHLSISPEVLQAVRKDILESSVRLGEGAFRLQKKQDSLAHAAESEQKRSMQIWFDEASKRVDARLEHLRKADEALRLLEEKQAAGLEQPDLSRAPGDVLEQLYEGKLSLPSGGPSNVEGSGSGFEKACPAADYADLEEGDGSSNLLLPASGMISAGTWAYPSGAIHLGMDLAAPMYSNVIAPADGVIVYASAVTGDGGGYLGNWIGWPYGGGNTIAMIARSNSKLYGITFAHLSSRLKVRAGQQVRQGDVIALSGNTGNSTGPHIHIELFTIRSSFDEAAEYFSRTADFAFGCGWDKPATCSQFAGRVRPEKYFTK